MSPQASREIAAHVLRALADKGQRATADAAGVSESRLSRWKSDDAQGGGLHLGEVADVLAALGLAVIPLDAGELSTLPAEELKSLRFLARRYLEREA